VSALDPALSGPQPSAPPAWVVAPLDQQAVRLAIFHWLIAQRGLRLGRRLR